jgi:methylglyoxal synthase
MDVRKNIALIAHDNRKADLLEWATFNRDLLARHRLFGTGTTGRLLAEELGNIPIACNRSSADFMISSPLMSRAYERLVVDYDEQLAGGLVG